MNPTKVVLHFDLELAEGEAFLLWDFCNSNNQAIPEAIRNLMLMALTVPTDVLASIHQSEKFEQSSALQTTSEPNPSDIAPWTGNGATITAPSE